MKCPKCRKEMNKEKYKENVYYYECPNCHHTFGKPKEADNNG